MNIEKDFASLFALAGLVQKIAQDCKVGLPLFDELVMKTTKLQTQLLATSVSLGSFLDTFQKIADAATHTKGSSTDIGICLTRIVLRHRAIEAHLQTLTRALSDCFTYPIQNKVEEWKKMVKSIDRDHAREFKKMRSVIKKKADQITKLRKRYSKDKTQGTKAAIDQHSRDLTATVKSFENKEKQTVSKIGGQERTHFTALATSFKPIIGEEYGMLLEIEQLTEVMDKLNNIISHPRLKSDTSDSLLSIIQASKEKFCYATPPESPGGSTMGSRRGSLRSLVSTSSRASAASSRASSASRTSYTQDNYSSRNSFNQDTGSLRSQDNGSLRSQDTGSIASNTPSLNDNETKVPSRDSIISSRSQDSGFPSNYYSLSSQQLFINESELSRTGNPRPESKTGIPTGEQNRRPGSQTGEQNRRPGSQSGEQNRRPVSQTGEQNRRLGSQTGEQNLRPGTGEQSFTLRHPVTSRPPLPTKPRPLVPNRSSSLDAGREVLSPLNSPNTSASTSQDSPTSSSFSFSSEAPTFSPEADADTVLRETNKSVASFHPRPRGMVNGSTVNGGMVNGSTVNGATVNGSGSYSFNGASTSSRPSSGSSNYSRGSGTGLTCSSGASSANTRFPEPVHYSVPRATPVACTPRITAADSRTTAESRTIPRSFKPGSADESVYSTPKHKLPNFALEKLDMVLPLPIYMNTQLCQQEDSSRFDPQQADHHLSSDQSRDPNLSSDQCRDPNLSSDQCRDPHNFSQTNHSFGTADSLLETTNPSLESADISLESTNLSLETTNMEMNLGLESEEEMVTPTIEQLSILDLKVYKKAGLDTSSGSGSMGSSSGYGSIGFDTDMVGSCISDYNPQVGSTQQSNPTAGCRQYAPILGSSQYSPPLGSSSDNSAVRSGQYNRTQSEIEPTSRVEPPDYTSAVQDQCGVETCTDVQGLYGVETCTGTLKRSHSVGVSAAKSFDRHNPARQSIAGDNDLRRPKPSPTHHSFIPKPNKPTTLNTQDKRPSGLPRLASQTGRKKDKLRDAEIISFEKLNVYSV